MWWILRRIMMGITGGAPAWTRQLPETPGGGWRGRTRRSSWTPTRQSFRTAQSLYWNPSGVQSTPKAGVGRTGQAASGGRTTRSGEYDGFRIVADIYGDGPDEIVANQRYLD